MATVFRSQRLLHSPPASACPWIGSSLVWKMQPRTSPAGYTIDGDDVASIVAPAGAVTPRYGWSVVNRKVLTPACNYSDIPI